MAEIITKVVKLEPNSTHVAGTHDYLITVDHTLADIARWIVDEGWSGEVVCSMLDYLEDEDGT